MEHVYFNRRNIIRGLGFAGASALMATNAQAGLFDLFKRSNESTDVPSGTPGLTRLDQYRAYSNAYEFGTSKSDPAAHEDSMVTEGWTVNVDGKIYDIDTLRGMPFAQLPEQDFDFRCVEAWGMRVNYNGFSLSNILNAYGDTSKKFVRFTSVQQDDLPGQGLFSSFSWPYTETLTMEEAMNPICWAVFGNYGTESVANGAPFRVNVPWKYGYASPKFVVGIECTDDHDEGTWGKLSRQEYAGDMKIVNPNQPHPRWSQASHRHITSDGTSRIPTQYLNGYEAEVGHLYK